MVISGFQSFLVHHRIISLVFNDVHVVLFSFSFPCFSISCIMIYPMKLRRLIRWVYHSLHFTSLLNKYDEDMCFVLFCCLRLIDHHRCHCGNSGVDSKSFAGSIISTSSTAKQTDLTITSSFVQNQTTATKVGRIQEEMFFFYRLFLVQVMLIRREWKENLRSPYLGGEYL